MIHSTYTVNTLNSSVLDAALHTTRLCLILFNLLDFLSLCEYFYSNALYIPINHIRLDGMKYNNVRDFMCYSQTKKTKIVRKRKLFLNLANNRFNLVSRLNTYILWFRVCILIKIQNVIWRQKRKIIRR